MNYKLIFIFILFTSSLFAQSLAQMGWPKALEDVYNYTQKTRKNYVLLVSRLPTIVIDFRSNQGIKNSINSLSFQKDYHPGHKMIGWACKIKDVSYNSFIGFSGESTDQHKAMLDSGWGLTSLLAHFTDGFIQTPNDLEERFNNFNAEFEKKPNGDFYLIANLFEVSDSDCENIVNEVFNYTSHENEPYTKFGLLLDPRKYEGAGCGSFAIHFFEQISRFKKIANLFTRSFKIPEHLFGNGTILPEHVEIPDGIKNIQSQEPVSKFRLISSDWSEGSKKNLDMSLIDPELVILWQKQFFAEYFNQHPEHSAYKKFFTKKTKRGLWETVNNHYNGNQTQNQYIEIDKNYDERASIAVTNAQSQLQNSRLTFFKFLNFPGIIVENK